MLRVTVVCAAVSLLAACSGTPRAAALPARGSLYVFRLSPPALVEIADDLSVAREIPVTVPEGCSLDGVHAPPQGATLALQLTCSFGQAVIFIDTASGAARQPITGSDSHFMAWAYDGSAAYLKIDTMNRPRIVLASTGGETQQVLLTDLAYDVAPEPGVVGSFLFSFSRGMGLGSETWHARDGGRVVQQVLADPHAYISLARWSPDGTQVALIKVPDSAVPFTVGEAWVMAADGSGARKLADADAGHGFAPSWSPDGKQIAFVVRDNANDPAADQDAAALRSNIAIADVISSGLTRLTALQGTRVEAPLWSPDGKSVAFTAVADDTMNVYIADIGSGQVRKVLNSAACCPVWLRK